MKELKEFISRYEYWLHNILSYNSYRTWTRSEVRDYDSISITEVLGLIIDPTMEFCKRYYSDKMKEACEYWTWIHSDIEKNIKWWKSKKEWIHIQYRLALLKEWINLIESEKLYSKNFKSLPVITGTIDWLTDDTVIDFKTSRTDRNFKSVKYQLQLAWYRWLSWYSGSRILYLNWKKYSVKDSEDMEYYDKVWLQLLEYSNKLYELWQINNLYIK
jgi:hypothetical protein